MKKYKSLLTSIVLVGAVLSVYSSVSINPIKAVKRKDSNYFSLKNVIVGCQSTEREIGERKAVLRIDDPHAFFLNDVVFAMVDNAVAKNIPVVLGVIPKGIEKDTQLITFLKHNVCNVEVALHGWDHSTNPPEFQFLTEEEAFQKMSKGKWTLETLLGKPIITFIAPENKYSEGTLRAAQKIGFKVFSSEKKGKYGYNASTYDFDKEELVPTYEVIHQCMSNFDEGEPCVIMIHPQDYATNGKLDEEKFEGYLHLIEILKNMDVSFVTFEDLVRIDPESFKFTTEADI